MPSDTIGEHPTGKNKIYFTEEDHSYTDSVGKKYTSVTTLIGKAFAPFDSESVAARCSEKWGKPVSEILDEWKQKGEHATYIGTRMHENAENYIKGNASLLHDPEDVEEKIRFDGVYKTVNKLKSKFDINNFETEKIIFSPSFKIAGSIDLLVKVNNKRYIIFDWKCLSKGLSKTSFNNECGCVFSTKNIPNSNYWHYALQLGLYEAILKYENYIDPNSTVSRALLVYNNGVFNIEKLPDLSVNVWQLIAWKQSEII